MRNAGKGAASDMVGPPSSRCRRDQSPDFRERTRESKAAPWPGRGMGAQAIHALQAACAARRDGLLHEAAALPVDPRRESAKALATCGASPRASGLAAITAVYFMTLRRFSSIHLLACAGW